MDRFVIRAPTWKTLNYSSMAAQSITQKCSTSDKKPASSQTVDNKKQPLQQKQLNEVVKTYDFDKRLDDLFRSNQENAENFNANSNDSGLSSASSISPHQLDENVPRCIASPLKSFTTPTKNYSSNLGDYVDCPTRKENDTCLPIKHTSNSHKKAVESMKIVEKIEFSKNLPPRPYATLDKPAPTTNNMIMARIQRDLNSPSAAARIKALKAIKSPTKSAYTYFDIPESEQSLHFPEPPSLQEIMRNIVVYVEVRSGEDNRSAGVRKVIEALGARVNLSLKSDTTHVVFKDGLLSTFKKATQLGIPVVSILWIEACKNKQRICDPKDYPISNLDRYENPELYTKMKRIKSMQPDSECNKRVRAKAAGGSTPNESTPTQKTAGAIKKTSTFIGGTPTSSRQEKKTDISQFFKKLERPTSNSTTGGDVNSTLPESPATQFLNRINSECYTPLVQLKKTTAKKDKNKIEIYDEESREEHTQFGGIGNSPKAGNNARKTLDFFQTPGVGQTTEEKHYKAKKISPNKEIPVNTRSRRSSVATPAPQPIVEADASLCVNMQLASPSALKKTKPHRRHSHIPASEIETAMNIMAISTTPSTKIRRRSSMHTPKDMTMETPNKINIQPPILEENNELEIEQKLEKSLAPGKTVRSSNRRRTFYEVKTMDQRDLKKANENATVEIEKSPAQKSTRGRTIYISKTMDTSEVKEDSKYGNIASNVSTRRRTCNSLRSLEHTKIQPTPFKAKPLKCDQILDVNKSELALANNTNGNVIANKIELSNKMMDFLKEKEAPPPTNKDEKKTQRRRTLYTPQKVNDTKITSLSNVSSGVTPSSFIHGKIACSTLLEDTANKSKLVSTPPADNITGKLLEETTKTATPIIFSSTRKPTNKRRTLFDVSMDIITQRLQCINQSARKSLALPTPSTDNINADVIPLNTSLEFKKSNQMEYNTHTPTSADTPTESHNDANTGNATPKVATLKKKRKLFMPNEMLLSPLSNATNATATSLNSNTNKSATESEKCITSITTSVTKRRRTLMPISQPQPTTVTLKDSAISTTPTVRQRRSTLDFEQIQHIKTNTNNSLDKNKKLQDVFVSAPSSSSSSTKEPTTIDVVKSKKMPVLVYTNMHHQQVDVIREAINKLGTFALESCVTNSTTHLVSLEPRRTLNLLRALARGLWIVEYSWILESLNAGKWMPEEPYELRGFTRSIEICRSERQAFGERYKCELFHKFGSFYISSQSSPIKKEHLSELIKLCGGRVVPSRQKARYIIGDANRCLEDKCYLTPYWILDSITQMQIMKINKYTYPLPEGEKPATQLLLSEKNNKIQM